MHDLTLERMIRIEHIVNHKDNKCKSIRGPFILFLEIDLVSLSTYYLIVSALVAQQPAEVPLLRLLSQAKEVLLEDLFPSFPVSSKFQP